jgi:phosphoribosylformylglycinamidine synthase
MFLSVPKMNVQEVKKVFMEENVDATVIGEFTQNKRLEVGNKGYLILDLDLIFLFNPPKSVLVSEWTEPDSIEPDFSQPRDLVTLLLRLLSAPNITSKESVIRSYDHEVQGNTVLKPLQGKNSGPNDAAVIKPLIDSYRGIVISNGMNPDYGKIDPYWMAASSIDEAIRNNISVGGKRIALLDNFTWGNPEKPDRMGGLVRAVQACYDYSKMFKTPFISGKDSLYNESPLGPVTPTLLITAIGIISDIRKTVSVALKNPGDPLFIVGKTYDELGGSEYYKLLGFLGNNVPKVRSEAKNTIDTVATAIEKGYVKACHDISEGGIAVAAAEMAFSGDLGVNLHLKNVPRSGDLRDDTLLFSESNSRFLLEVSQDREEEFREQMKEISFSLVGEVLEKGDFSVLNWSDQPIIRISILDLMKAWKNTVGGIK